MSWLERIRAGTGRPRDEEEEAAAPAIVERRSPALEAMFSGMRTDRSHSFLDFGPATNEHLRLLTPFARQIRFAGLVPEPPSDPSWSSSVRSLPPNTEHPYDVVLSWDVFDRVQPSERAHLVQRLADITAPGARLYAVIDASGATARSPVRSQLVSLGRVSQEVIGPPEPAHPALLPAQVEKLLEPFTIKHAFTLRSGQREYMALRS